jgi:pimeloyl-ACP methyl ester carboxylesterase
VQRPTPENFAFAEEVAREFERGEIGLLLKRLGGYPQLNFAERLGVRTVLTLSGMSRSLAAVVRGLHGLDVTEEQLRANTVPVLTIVGGKDGLLSDARALHDHMANHKLVILLGADHGSAGGAASFLPELEAFMQNSTPKTST